MSKYIVNSTQVPNAVIDEIMPQISDAAFKCYVLIVRKTVGWHKESDSISISQFEKLTGKSRNTVIKCCKELEAAGLIVKETKDHQSSVYKLNQFNICTSANSELEVVQNLNQGSANSELEVVQNLNTQNKIKPTKQNKNKNTPLSGCVSHETAITLIDNFTADNITCAELTQQFGLSAAVAKSWAKVRRSKRAPLTPLAFKRFVNQAKLANLSIEAAAAICAERAWSGFEAVWLTQQRGQPAAGMTQGNAFGDNL